MCDRATNGTIRLARDTPELGVFLSLLFNNTVRILNGELGIVEGSTPSEAKKESALA
jgi:hypothetical protein